MENEKLKINKKIKKIENKKINKEIKIRKRKIKNK